MTVRILAFFGFLAHLAAYGRSTACSSDESGGASTRVFAQFAVDRRTARVK